MASQAIRKWLPAFGAALAGAGWIVAHRSSAPAMFEDTDTRVLLAKINERGNPWSWFAGDWPLENHFYRPISTLAFELDNWLHPGNAAGFGLTQALIAAACVLLLFWLVRELTDSPAAAAGCSGLFALWTVDKTFSLPIVAAYAAVVVAIGGIIRHGFQARRWLPAAAVLWVLSGELAAMHSLWFRMVGWLPGRTASVMTIFCLVAMAAYARYERLGAERIAKQPGPLDPPATKNTRAPGEETSASPIWAVLAILATALALGSYEQAVMLPACLLGVALTLRFQGYRVRFGWQAGFWSLLVGYLVLRAQLLPQETSGYQEQQLRYGPGVLLALTGYLFPAGGTFLPLYTTVTSGLVMLLTSGPWLYAWEIVSNVWTFIQARRVWVWALAGWALSFLAFLPMAWLNHFEHYHYWPMALRSLLVVALVRLAWLCATDALAPQALQAPPRPSPAPGSLLRP